MTLIGDSTRKKIEIKSPELIEMNAVRATQAVYVKTTRAKRKSGFSYGVHKHDVCEAFSPLESSSRLGREG